MRCRTVGQPNYINACKDGPYSISEGGDARFWGGRTLKLRADKDKIPPGQSSFTGSSSPKAPPEQIIRRVLDMLDTGAESIYHENTLADAKHTALGMIDDIRATLKEAIKW